VWENEPSLANKMRRGVGWGEVAADGARVTRFGCRLGTVTHIHSHRESV
jgi:hypothetical protein